MNSGPCKETLGNGLQPTPVTGNPVRSVHFYVKLLESPQSAFTRLRWIIFSVMAHSDSVWKTKRGGTEDCGETVRRGHL